MNTPYCNLILHHSPRLKWTLTVLKIFTRGSEYSASSNFGHSIKDSQAAHLASPLTNPEHYHRNSPLPPSPDLLLPSNQHITMADKLRTLQQLEHLQQKYIGTGHADTSRHEWTNNIVRDSYASYIGHPALLSYMALGMGESRELVRAAFVEKMVRGVGAAPREDEGAELAAGVGVQGKESG